MEAVCHHHILLLRIGKEEAEGEKKIPSVKASLILIEVLASIPGELMSVDSCKGQLLRAHN